MTIQLPNDVESSLLAAVHSGQFASLDDAMTEAARLLLQKLHQGQSWPKQPASGEGKAARQQKPLTPDELNQRLLASGRITQLPDPAQDIDDDDPEDIPVAIEGEPLSETIIRERR